MSVHIDIPGYQLLSKIGEGGTATVWRARQESLDREVAIKILRQQFATDTGEVQAFIREAHAVAKLNSRHIIRIIDVGQHGDLIYLIMEYVDGYPVQRLVSDGQPLSQKQALKIAMSVADALNEAWGSEKIIHRDIKPDNIILNKRGEVKVADLGLASIVDPRGHLVGEEDGVIAGTPNYMSPEQAAGSSTINFATDMYSLGAVLYHMLTGRMPFVGREAHDVIRAQIEDQIPCPRDINPKMTVSCAQLITRLMMKDPAQRYSDWKSVMADINRIIEGRMLIMKYSPEGPSTVAPRQDAPPTSGASLGTSHPKASGPHKFTPPPVPAWLRITLNTAFATFLAWVSYTLLWAPHRALRSAPGYAVPPPTSPQPPAPPRPTTAPRDRPTAPPGGRPSSQPPSRAPQRSDDFAILEEDRDVPLRHGNVDAAPAATREGLPPPGQASEIDTLELLNILKNSIIHIAVSDGLPAAAALLAQHRHEPALGGATRQLDEMEYFLHPDHHPHALIANAFRTLIGKDTFINVGTRRVDFRVEAVTGGSVSTIVKGSPPNGTPYPAELKIEVLEPDEQRRWLARSPSPVASFCMAILDLSAGRFAAAVEHAANCGPFAEPIRQFAARRLPPASE